MRAVTTAVPEEASVVVIGGGVIGTSIACHLAASGVTDVVLLERGELAGGSTSKAAGGVRATFSHPANIAMGMRGLDVYARFAELYGQDIDFARDGYLYLLSDQDSVDNFTQQVALHNHHGVPSEMVDPQRAQQISPLIRTDELLAACWSPQDGKATPESVVTGYASAARRHGARIIRHTEVLGITTSGCRITAVVSSGGTIRTGTVVCAAGAWSRQIGAMVDVDIPVTPVRRQLAFTTPVTDLPPASPSLTIDFPSNFYFHPEGTGMLMGWSDPRTPPGFSETFELDDWLVGLGPIAQRCAPTLLDYGIRTGWAGLYEITPDHNQIIDRASELETFLIATGYSGHGFLMGPATGEIVCDLYHQRPPAYDISAFGLDRFAGGVARRAESNIV